MYVRQIAYSAGWFNATYHHYCRDPCLRPCTMPRSQAIPLSIESFLLACTHTVSKYIFPTVALHRHVDSHIFMKDLCDEWFTPITEGGDHKGNGRKCEHHFCTCCNFTCIPEGGRKSNGREIKMSVQLPTLHANSHITICVSLSMYIYIYTHHLWYEHIDLLLSESLNSWN